MIINFHFLNASFANVSFVFPVLNACELLLTVTNSVPGFSNNCNAGITVQDEVICVGQGQTVAGQSGITYNSDSGFPAICISQGQNFVVTYNSDFGIIIQV